MTNLRKYWVRFLGAVLMAIAVLFPLSLSAQSSQTSTMGRDFWVGFLYNINVGYSSTFSLVASSQTNCSVTAKCGSWTTTVNVAAGGSATITVPTSANIENYALPRNSRVPRLAGIHVTSTADIALYAYNYKYCTYDATKVLPTQKLGTSYIIQDYYNGATPWIYDGAEFCVVGTKNGTTVNVSFAATTAISAYNSLDVETSTTNYTSLSFTLDSGYVIQYMTPNTGTFTGATITSNHPVAVFQGRKSVEIPNYPYGASEHLYEQSIPTEYFGQEFVVVPDARNSATYDFIQVTSLYSDCQVYANSTYIGTTNNRRTYIRNTNFGNGQTPFVITTSKPASVCLYMSSCQYIGSNTDGDPSSVIIPPTEQFVSSASFNIHNTTNCTRHYANIVVRTADVSGMRLNGSDISANFSSLAGTPYSYYRRALPVGNHTLSNDVGKFNAWVYGYGYVESYAHVAAMSLRNLQYELFVDGDNTYTWGDTINVCQNSSHHFKIETDGDIDTRWYVDDVLQSSTDTALDYSFPTSGYHVIKALQRGDCTAPNFCDTLRLVVFVRPPAIGALSRSVYVDEFPYTVNGTAYDTAGSYTQHLTSAAGCDSILNITLTARLHSYNDTVLAQTGDSLLIFPLLNDSINCSNPQIIILTQPHHGNATTLYNSDYNHEGYRDDYDDILGDNYGDDDSEGSPTPKTGSGSNPNAIRYYQNPDIFNYSHFIGWDSLRIVVICDNGNRDTSWVYIHLVDFPDNVFNPSCALRADSNAFEMVKLYDSENGSDINSMSTPMVADMDGDGIPEILAPKFFTPDYNSDGFHVFDGRDGSFKYTITTPQFSLSGQTVTLADVDYDGHTELFLLCNDLFLRCYNYDGSLRWTSMNTVDRRYLLSAADIMGDGHVQIVCGPYLYNATTGTLLLSNAFVTDGTGKLQYLNDSRYPPCFMYALGDINSDGTQEICAGNTIYDIIITNNSGTDGNSWSVLRQAETLSGDMHYDGPTVLLDFDNDGDLDVCVIGSPDNLPNYTGYLCYLNQFTVNPYVWDGQSATIIAQTTYNIQGRDGPSIPYCGDLDGNGFPEIVFALDNDCVGGSSSEGMLAYTYDTAITGNMRLMHHHDLFAETSGFTVFDFNQDGRNEIVYRGYTTFYIVDGTTLESLSTPLTAYSGTIKEYPIVADVNGDGQAEIIVNCGKSNYGNYPHDASGHVSVYGSAIRGAWSSARKVWNQYAYNSVNINEDLTVPQHPISPATRFPNGTQPYNKFLGQVPYINRRGNMFNPVPDVAGVQVSLLLLGDSARFTVEYRNDGDASLQSPYGITVYKNIYRGERLWTDTVMQPLATNQTLTHSFALPRSIICGLAISDDLVIALNDMGTGIAQHGSTHPECDTTNNRLLITQLPTCAFNDTLQVFTGVGTIFNPTLNDSIRCDSVKVTIVTPPLHGTASVGTGSNEGINNNLDDPVPPPPINVTYFPDNDLVEDPYGLGFISQPYIGPDSLRIAVGCDGVGYDTSWVIINVGLPTDTNATVCDSLTWYGTPHTTSGNYYHMLQSSQGLDSLLVLHLTINRSTVGDTSVIACDSYTWIDGNTYTASTTTNYILPTANSQGCDSVLTLHLTVNYSNIGTDVQTACDSFSWIDGNTYTDNNSTATYTLTNTASCDSVVTLHLTVNHSNTGDTTAVACDSFVWWNTNYTNSTDAPTHTYTNAAGCDSVVTLHLTVNHSNTGDTTAVACDSFTWWGTDYTASTDTPTHTYTNATGCDSVVTLHLTVNSSATSNNEATVHDTITANLLPYTWNGIVFNTPVEDTVGHVVNVAGCDSLIHYYLHVRNAVCVDTTVAYGYEDCLHAPIYGMHGDYQQRIQSIYQPYLLTHLVGQTIDSLHYDLAYMQNNSWGNQTWVVSMGTATRSNLYSSFDNDAVLTEVYRGPLPATSSGGMGIKLDSSFTYNGGRLLIQFTNATSGNSYASTWFNGLTPDYVGATRWATTYSGGNIMTLSGTREDQLPMVTFHYCRVDTTFLRPPINRFFDTTIIACDSLLWNNHTYTVSGTYRDTIVTTDNHDSLVTLHLTINHSSTFSTEGAINSYFSVDSTHVVEFSKGNLQYQASTDTWRFADHQYDIIGNNNNHISSTYSGWIDLFGWGCSGWNSGANAYQPYSTSTTASDYYPDGIHISSLTGVNAEADWAWHNAISNGGNQPHLWRTPTHDEWQYLFNGRTTVTNLPTPNARFAKAKVNNVYGVILFPDKYTHPADVATPVGINATDNTGMYGNIYNVTAWNKMEQAGAVFLPVPGYRNGTYISMLNQRASYYASSVGHFSNSADGIAFFFPGTIDLTVGLSPYCGNPVRPIKYLTKVKDTVITACNDYTWHGTDYHATGEYFDTLTNAQGCDSIFSLKLTLYHSYSEDSTLTVCDQTTWYGNTITQSGDFPHVVYSSPIDGCDSIITLHLTVNHSSGTLAEGASAAPFTVSEDVEVYFSPGNLQYRASTGQWRFAEHQYDYIGSGNLQVSSSYDGWIDLFGWGCSGWSNGSTTYYPYNISTTYSTYYQGDSLRGPGSEADWAWHNAIQGGGDKNHTWRTLSHAEWLYLINDRTTMTNLPTPNARYAKAMVNGTYGVILFPDTYTHPYGIPSPLGINQTGNTGWNGNNYSTSQWDEMESAGAVFLPAAGRRNGSSLTSVNEQGRYWSTDRSGNTGEFIYFSNTLFRLNDGISVFNGQSVRPVTTRKKYIDTTIDACNSYQFGTNIYTSSGVYTDSLQNTVGCDSIIRLNLIVNTPTHISETLTACDSLIWNGTKYTTSGNYTYAHTDVNGCTQVDTLHLTINQSNMGDTLVTACDSYTWIDGNTYTTSTSTSTHTFTGGNAVGCDSTVTLHLTVNHSNTGMETVTACDSYTWHGTEYTSSNSTATFTETNAAGCDSVVMLNLTINHSNTGTETVTACDSYTWHGTEYTSSNSTATFTETNAAGCDSIVTLNLTINHPQHTATTDIACETHTWNGTTYTASGNYTYTHIDANGCTQVDTLHLTINNPVHVATAETVCETYTWNGTTYTASGNYTYSHADANSCIQVDSLHLTVNHTSTGIETVTACNSYVWHGTEHFASTDTPTHTATNAVGCDSVTTLHLTINHCSTTTITACNSYSWHGATYSSSGTYIDGTDTLSLTINYSNTGTETITACDSYTWHGTEYTASNSTATFTETNAAGCDSIVTLSLTINHPQHTATSDIACETYTWNGTTYTASGNYTYSHADANGCIQVDTLHLTVNHTSTGIEAVTACNSYVWHGTEYFASTDTPTHTATNAVGCDSVTTLHLTINHCSTTTITACDSYSWHGTTYSASGTYIDGTDTLSLTINHSNTGTETVTACDSHTWHGTEYTASNSTATFTETNAAGCDSVVTLNLTINHSNTGTETVTACDSHTWHGTEYTSSNNTATFTETNVTGCDSVVTLNLTINHSTTGDTTATVCDSLQWHGLSLFSTGDTVWHTTNATGCDSTVTLHLTVNTSTSSIVHEEDFENNLPHSFNGYSFTSDTTGATIVIPNTAGCDSTIHYSLTVHWNNMTNDDSTVCASSLPLTWNGVVFTSAGTQPATLAGADGADSVVSMTLHVNPVYRDTVDQSICDNQIYTFEGVTYNSTDAGLHPHLLQTAAGCDSLRVLRLAVRSTSTGDTTAVACDSFTWIDGNTYISDTTLSASLLTQAGCDSLITLHLTILPSPVLQHIPDTVIDDGGSLTLHAHGADMFTWRDEGGALLCNDSVFAVSPNTSTVYYLTAFNQGNNLVYNGDFELGNTGFTTAYTYSTNLNPAGYYCVGPNAHNYHYGFTGAHDHTSGSGNYMIVNGSGNAGTNLWTQTVTVEPYTDYAFSVWGTNVSPYSQGYMAMLQFSINGSQIGDIFQLPTLMNRWTQFYEVWNSGPNTSATITILNMNTLLGGNDFGIDDISFSSLTTCQSYDTVNVFVGQHVDSIVCDNQFPFLWNGQLFLAPGAKTATLTGHLGQDSIVIMNVVAAPTRNNELAVTTCDSFVWNADRYTTTGDYLDTLTTTMGCDSVVTMHLTVNHSTTGDSTAVACDSFFWSGQWVVSSGQYTDTLTNAAGCDSIVTLNLSINHSNTGTETVTACNRFVWHGTEYTISTDTPTYTTHNAVGCDSVTTLHLTVNQCSATTITACDSYIWLGNTYMSSGTYIDGTDTLYLTIHHSSDSSLNFLAFANELPVMVNGTTYPTFGHYQQVFTNAAGCDSVFNIHIVPYPDNIDSAECIAEAVNSPWSIELKWSTAEVVSPLVIPFVGDIDSDAVPEVICFASNNSYGFYGVNRVLVYDTRTQQPIHQIDLPGVVSTVDGAPYGMVRLPNGHVVFVVVMQNGTMSAYDLTARATIPLWSTSVDLTAPNIGFADFNADGQPEVYVGNKIYNAVTGALIANNNDITNLGAAFCVNPTTVSPMAYDMTGDGKPELVLGNEIYSVNITNTNDTVGNSLTLVNSTTPPTGITTDGHAQAADFNLDGYVDLLISTKPSRNDNVGVYLWDVHNGEVSNPLIITANTWGKSVPLIADIDNDGQPEFVIQCGASSGGRVRAYKYNIPSKNFSLLWSMNVDEDSWSNSMSAFDFNNDGMTDLVISDQSSIKIVNGSGKSHLTGNDTLAVYVLSSLLFGECTVMQYPVIADVDDDGSAEIVACGRFGSGHTYRGSLNIFHSATTPWAPARKVWNQYMYNVTNINEDLTIPQYQFNNATVFVDTLGVERRPYNNFLQQATSIDRYGHAFVAVPDAVASSATAAIEGNNFTISLDVSNAGDNTLNAPYGITVYKNAYRGEVLHIETVSQALPQSSNQTITITLPRATICTFANVDSLVIALNDTSTGIAQHGGQQMECDTTNNIVTLSVPHNSTSTDTHIACDSYTWIDGITYMTDNNAATYTLFNAAGCDSITTLNLTIKESSSSIEVVTACNSFVWHGTEYTASTTTPTFTSTNIVGCDSITTLHLTINPCSTADITACDTFTWHGTLYTSSGQYYDGTDTLNLTINHSNSGDTIANACDFFTWWHTDYTNNTDDATHTFTNAAGCDSVVTLHLTIRQSTASSEVQTVCDNYNWFNGETLTTTGTYFDTITNASGCDSVVSLQLTVNYSNTGTDIQTACDSLQWIDGNTYTSSNFNSQFSIFNSVGCDSVVTLHLTINHSSAYTDTHSVCDSYTWIDGITYTAYNSDATYTLTNTEGCDSVVTLHLTLRHSTGSTIHDTVVENSLPHSFNGLSLTDSVSNLTVTLTNAAGCDSVIDYSLYVHWNAVTILDSSLCNDGLPITWNGIGFDTLVTHTTTMTRQLMLTTQGGADSTVVMRLTVHPIYDEHIYDTLYEGDTYPFEGTLYDTTGIYPHLLQTVAGCDSLRTLHLQYNRRTYLDSTLCSNQLPLLWNGLTFTEQGVDSLHLSATDGRDSLVVMRLNVLDTSSYTAVVHACDSLVWIDGNTYTQSNFSSRFTIPNSVGCDSVVTLQLTIDSTHYFTDHQEICDSIQWINGEWYSEDTAGVTAIIPTVAGCDSVVTLELVTGLTVTSELYDTMCYNDTYSWHNLTVSGTAPYQMELFALADTLRTVDGCDSVVTMHLTKIAQPRIHFVDTTKICSLGQYSILAEATAPLTLGGEPQPLPYLVWSSSPTDTLLDGHENDNPLYVSPQVATAYTLFADYSETYTCPTRSSITLLPLTYPEVELKVIPEALSYNHLDFTAIDITKHEYKHRIWYIDVQRQVETGRSITDRASFDADSVIVTLELYDSITGNGCSGTAVRVIPVNRIALYAPNIFTPTRDDNNHFDIITQGVISGELYIYNREGLLVYYTPDYTNGWDGHTSDGTLCIQSAYVWKLIYRAIDRPESNQIEVGTVTLIR